MSEKRDLWVPAALLLGGAGLLAWNLAGGRSAVGLLALALGIVGALACLAIRIKRRQGDVVLFGLGVGLLLAATSPAAGGAPARWLPWVVAALGFLWPMRRLGPRLRRGCLAGAAVLAVLGALAVLGRLPGSLTGLFLAGALFLAVQVLHARPRRALAPPPGPRVCLMGGSFDPFHQAHRALAVAALKVVDRLLVVPAGAAPHKRHQEGVTPFHHRLAMARLGVEGLPRVEVLELEGRRAGPSYTVDTLEVVRRSFPEGSRFLLLLGADMFQDLPTWHAWETLVAEATLLVAGRPGFDLERPPELEGRAASVERLEAPLLDVSSTALRADLAAGRDTGDRIAPNVMAYIRDHGLYGTGPAAG